MVFPCSVDGDRRVYDLPPHENQQLYRESQGQAAPDFAQAITM